MRPEGELESDLRPVGLALFLAALTTLIGGCVVGYLVIRSRAETWPPPGIPGAPSSLWVSTVLLILSSLTIRHAVRGVRGDDPPAIRRGAVITLFLGLCFLASQMVAGADLLAAVSGPPEDPFTFTFLMLAGLHGVHILGGLIPLTIVTVKALKGGYDHRPEDKGVRLVAAYWHYLDIVWLVLFVMLMV